MKKINNNSLNVLAPGSHAEAVTPSDSTVFDEATRALFIGGSGNINVTMENGPQVTFTGVVAGTVLPIRVTAVYSTSTTATNMVAIW